MIIELKTPCGVSVKFDVPADMVAQFKSDWLDYDPYDFGDMYSDFIIEN